MHDTTEEQSDWVGDVLSGTGGLGCQADLTASVEQFERGVEWQAHQEKLDLENALKVERDNIKLATKRAHEKMRRDKDSEIKKKDSEIEKLRSELAECQPQLQKNLMPPPSLATAASAGETTEILTIVKQMHRQMQYQQPQQQYSGANQQWFSEWSDNTGPRPARYNSMG